MRSVDFYQQSRAVQERFLSGASGDAAPQFWLRVAQRVPIPWGWGVSALAALGVFVGLLAIGYGTAGSRLALAPIYMAAVYGAAVWMFVICILGAARVLSAPGWLPFQTGVYLFPIGVVDARTVRIQVYPFSELEHAEAPGGQRLTLRFKRGASFSFAIPNAEKAEVLVDTALKRKEQVARLEAEQNAHDLATLDPLLDTGIPSPFLPTQPLARQVPFWARWWTVVALAPALGLAWPIWQIRNVMSERVMFGAAQAADSPQAYRDYLATGGTRREVRDLLLPRAELRIARESGSVAAVEKVVEKYKDLPVHSEFELALRELLLAELDTAKKKGTLAALRGLKTAFTRGDLIEIELEDAFHEVYAKALKKYESQAPEKDDEAIAFFRKLVAYAEKHGPHVEIRFRRELRESVDAADKVVRKSQYYGGASNIPSRYFDAKHAAKRERRIADRIIARFDRTFPHEILKVQLAKPIGQDEALPAVKVPTLLVTHSTLMSGAYMSRDPVGTYVGVGVVFEGSFQIPNAAETIDYRLSVWRQPKIAIIKKEKLTPEQVYDSLTVDAFNRFAKKFLLQMFRD